MNGNVIYLDVLIILNLFVNYFLFLGTSFFLHQRKKRWRMLLGAGVGSLFSLLIFADELSFFWMLLIKLPLAALLVWIAFGFQDKALYIKTVFAFFGVNFLFAGIMMGIQLLLSPTNMLFRNGTVYFNLSALTLVCGTLAAYGVIRLIGYFLNSRVKTKEIRKIVIQADGRETILSGFVDTGNKLTDQISGLPIIICEYQSIREILPTELQESFRNNATTGIERLEGHRWASRIRFVPFQVVGHSGMLMAFKPDHFYILSENEDKQEEKEALIGVTGAPVSQGEYHAVLSASLI